MLKAQSALIGLLLFLPILSALGQNPKDDSAALLDSLKLARNDKDRVDFLNDLAFLYYDYDDSIALDYNLQAYKLAKRIGYKPGIKESLNNEAIFYLNASDFRKSINLYLESIEIKTAGSEVYDAYSYDRLGYIYSVMGNYDSAQLFINKGLNIKGIRNFADAYNRLLRMKVTIDLQIWDLASARQVIYKLKDYYLKTNQRDQLIEVIYLLTILKNKEFDYDSMRYYCKEMAANVNSLDHPHYKLLNSISLSELEVQQANYLEALSHCIDAINFLETYQYEPYIATLYLQTGMIYNELLQFNVSSEYLFKGLNISERLGMSATTGMLYCELAWANKSSRSFDAALNYLNRAEVLFTQNGDKFGLSYVYNLRGLTLIDLNNPTLAREQLTLAKLLREEIGNTKGLAAVVSNIGLTYKMENNLSEALNYQIRASEYEKNIKDPVAQAMTYSQITSLYILMNQPAEADKYLQIVKETATNYKSLYLWRDYYYYSSQLAQSQKDFKKAFEYLSLNQQYKDSISSSENFTKLAELQALYKIENKDKELQQQRKNLEMQQRSLEQKNKVILFGAAALILLLLVILVIYLYYKASRKNAENLVQLNKEIKEQNEEIMVQAEELSEANQTITKINDDLEGTVAKRTKELSQAYHELDTFFYRSSHDFRRPLTTFMGLAEVAKVTLKEESAQSLFELVNTTARNLDKMLMKFQSISLVSSNELNVSNIHLPEMIQEIVTTSVTGIKKNDVEIEKDLQVSYVYSSPTLLKIILENLIENALRYHVPHRPTRIRIEAKMLHSNLHLIVEDNGMGIESDFKERIFDLYFRGTEKSEGTGLGLFIVRKAVLRLGGHIEVESQHDAGAKFTIQIPVIPQ